MEDRRIFKRLKKPITVQYTFDDFTVEKKRWNVSLTRDVSEGGICITTDKQCNVDDSLLLNIKIPTQPKDLFMVTAKVKGSIGKGNIYKTNLMFLELPEEFRSALREYIAFFDSK
jgi:hypothetical protein